MIASLLLGTAAATIGDPQPGALDPDPVFRQPPPESSLPERGDGDERPRPGVSLPGLGVTVPIPIGTIPPWLRLVALGAVVILGLVLIVNSLRGTSRHERLDAVAPSSTGTRESDVANAAGRAAEHILSATEPPHENDVYLAWWEMTNALEVGDPASCTPGEFAEAAVAAGLDPTDVDTLTTHFEEVRYGDAPVTDDRREVVATALERIERRLHERDETTVGKDS